MIDDLKQGSRLGNFELVLKVGRGGMATVWVARERGAVAKDDRLAAVKVMLPELADESEFIKMFLDEVRVVRSIRHPNVVEVHDLGEHAGMMWMAMEWVEGESLHTVIAEAGKRAAIPPEMAVRIIADAAAGVHAAHELRDLDGSPRGVVHRDISPHNILISTSGAVKLVDFGVAKAVGRMSEATRAGQLKGKFGYMSPEQALGNEVDRRSDIFSLGIVLFELTTSRRLFRGENELETLRLVTSGAIPKPSSIDPKYPRALELIVLRALARDVSMRYQTAAELAHELRAYLKAERLIVPESGVAGILKRVVGDRIEQRRRAVRASLRELSLGGGPEEALLPNDPAFTPTGRDRLPVGDEHAAAPSSRSGVKSAEPSLGLVGTSSPEYDESRARRPAWISLSAASVLGYAIGLMGLMIAVLVLLFMR